MLTASSLPSSRLVSPFRSLSLNPLPPKYQTMDMSLLAAMHVRQKRVRVGRRCCTLFSQPNMNGPELGDLGACHVLISCHEHLHPTWSPSKGLSAMWHDVGLPVEERQVDNDLVEADWSFSGKCSTCSQN